MKLVQWPLMGGLLRLVQRLEDWAGPQPAHPLLAVPNLTIHPSTASVPITVLLYNGPLLCSFNVGIKGLKARYAMLANVGSSSVRSPSGGHILKTKQDKTTDYSGTLYITADIVGSVPAFRYSSDAPIRGRYYGF